jgi:hypothetical protein
MTQITQRTGALCLIASALMVSSDVLRLAVGLVSGPGSAATLTHTLTFGLALAGMYALLLALTGIYFGDQQALGVSRAPRLPERVRGHRPRRGRLVVRGLRRARDRDGGAARLGPAALDLSSRAWCSPWVCSRRGGSRSAWPCSAVGPSPARPRFS